MVRMGTRSLISGSSTSREDPSHQKALVATEVEKANGVLLLAMRNLAATISAVVARLDRLEGAHFDACNPADPGAVGLLAIQTPESLSSERTEDSSLRNKRSGPFGAAALQGRSDRGREERAPPKR